MNVGSLNANPAALNLPLAADSSLAVQDPEAKGVDKTEGVGAADGTEGVDGPRDIVVTEQDGKDEKVQGNSNPELEPPPADAQKNIGENLEKLLALLQMVNDQNQLQQQIDRLKSLETEIQVQAMRRLEAATKAVAALEILEKYGITDGHVGYCKSFRAAEALKEAGLAEGSTSAIASSLRKLSNAIDDSIWCGFSRRSFFCCSNKSNLAKMEKATDRLCDFISDPAVASLMKHCIMDAAVKTAFFERHGGRLFGFGARHARRDFFQGALQANMSKCLGAAIANFGDSAAEVKAIQMAIQMLTRQMEENGEKIEELLMTLQGATANIADLLARELGERQSVDVGMNGMVA